MAKQYESIQDIEGAKAVTTICLSIDRNIEQVQDRGLLAQNIAGKLRHLVEASCVFIYNYEHDDSIPVEFLDQSITNAVSFVSGKAKYRYLKELHDGLQVSLSHYVPTEDESVRLMEKYYHKLIMLKDTLEKEFGLSVLRRIYDYPIYMDSTYHDYYSIVIPEIDRYDRDLLYASYADGRYYVQKVKPIVWNKRFYYEITLCPANDQTSKFDRITVFSKKYISTRYSIKAQIVNSSVVLYGRKATIRILTNYYISIRPCEINNLGKVFGLHYHINGNYKEYEELMQFLTRKRINLLDICILGDKEIQEEYSELKLHYIKTLLDKAKAIISVNGKGSNVLRYLLYSMRNRVIKDQLNTEQCSILSDLYLNIKCDRFDTVPFTMGLCKHMPLIDDLYKCIDPSDRHDELLARKLIISSETEGEIYTPVSDVILEDGEQLNDLITRYNSKQYSKHVGNQIIQEYRQLYIKGYEDSCIGILNRLNGLAEEVIPGYEDFATIWLEEHSPDISDDKKEIITKLFSDSKVALLYGAAGTGKTTVIRILAEMLHDKNLVFLATTNTAVNNLRKIVNNIRFEYKTIASYLKKENRRRSSYDMVIIDECSTAGNDNILEIVNDNNFERLFLVGDTYQLESINYGNWFMLARHLMDKQVWYELEHTHRTNNKDLLILWDLVRNESHKISDFLSRHSFNCRIGEEILNTSEEDEIVLCQNYDGLFGINNINSIMQTRNPGKEAICGINAYKVGDPVIFNESRLFGGVLYNNLKGRITGISDLGSEVYFEIMVDSTLDSDDVTMAGADYIGEKDGRPIVGFSVKKMTDTDEDDKNDMVVPFNIAYAMSIYKAQGLEYKSVKVIIPNDLEESITPNAFYTAITRAKESLRIYWSPETQQKILERLKFTPSTRVLNIIKEKMKNK